MTTSAFRPTTASQIKPGNTVFFVLLGVGILTDVASVAPGTDIDDCPVIRIADRQGNKQIMLPDTEVFVRY